MSLFKQKEITEKQKKQDLYCVFGLAIIAITIVLSFCFSAFNTINLKNENNSSLQQKKGE